MSQQQGPVFIQEKCGCRVDHGIPTRCAAHQLGTNPAGRDAEGTALRDSIKPKPVLRPEDCCDCGRILAGACVSCVIEDYEASKLAGGEAVVPSAPLDACDGCERGYEVKDLDDDGVLTRLSGKPGRPCHSVDDKWWLCRRAATRAQLIEEISQQSRRIPTCGNCGEVLYDLGELYCEDCAEPAAADVRPPQDLQTKETKDVDTRVGPSSTLPSQGSTASDHEVKSS